MPSEWPRSGTLRVDKLSLRYRPGLPLVLKEVSFGPVAAGTRIGVCGRTGSGKSTLAMAIFRLIEPASGAIQIDGINTQAIPLARLRAKLSMVPQAPTIFAGSVRYNVDPTSKHSDAAITAAVGAVEMSDWVAAAGGLDGLVAAGGADMSMGQRQLLCLARVMLEQPKLLVMDEATSSLDRATDNRIQRLLRKRSGPLSKATILSIAHRLETILDYDTVCVLEAGQVAEYGPPHELLQRKNGLFKRLVDEHNSRKSTAVEAASTAASRV